MRLVLSQISGLTTQVSEAPRDSSRRQYYRNLNRRVPHNYVMESKAHRALEELTRLWNQLKQQQDHRLSEYQQVFDECVLYKQGMDIIFLEMCIAPPALKSPVVAPQAVANPPAPEEEDYGVIDMEIEPIEEAATVDLVVAEEVGGVVDMEVEPIQEAATVDCKEQELREWMRIFCAIPTVSTPPAPAPAEKVEEVFEKEHVEVKDPIIGMWICFQPPTATQATVAVSRKFVIFFLLQFLVYDFHLTLVFICSIPTLQLPHRLPIYHLRMNKLISTLMIFRIE